MFSYMAKYGTHGIKDFLVVSRALADENRVRVLRALEGRELCLCQLTEFLRLAPSTVSKHMAVLHQAGLVAVRRRGRWRYFRLAGKDTPPVARGGIAWVRAALRNDPGAIADAERLRKVLKMNLERLCDKK